MGPGNIGTDLLAKLQRSEHVEVRVHGRGGPGVRGPGAGPAAGAAGSAGGVDWLLDQPELPDLVFEATSARAHLANAPRYAEAGIQVVDLTPAAVGPMVCPPVNLREHLAAPNVNMITCGGQATIPVVRAVSAVTPVPYAEIVASIASRSAGPGTRANIDEFTVTTARAIESIGGAERGKAVIILNPVDPPMIMRDTVFCAISPDADRPRSRTRCWPWWPRWPGTCRATRCAPTRSSTRPPPDWGGWARVAVFLEVRGNGDYLPPWAGNLDIMTARCLSACIDLRPAVVLAGHLVSLARTFDALQLAQPRLHPSRNSEPPALQNYLVNTLSYSVTLFLSEHDAFDRFDGRIQIYGDDVDCRFHSFSPLCD